MVLDGNKTFLCEPSPSGRSGKDNTGGGEPVRFQVVVLFETAGEDDAPGDTKHEGNRRSAFPSCDFVPFVVIALTLT